MVAPFALDTEVPWREPFPGDTARAKECDGCDVARRDIGFQAMQPERVERMFPRLCQARAHEPLPFVIRKDVVAQASTAKSTHDHLRNVDYACNFFITRRRTPSAHQETVISLVLQGLHEVREV